MTAQPAVQDPFAAADEAQPLKPGYYAQVNCDAWFCVLEKGTGKVVFDPARHPIEQRRTAINISLAPLPEQNIQFPLVREMVAESKEWASIVWPSAKGLGINSTRELNGRWAKVEVVPTGRKYTNRAGENKDATTFKFVALYADEAAARAAYQAGGAQPVEEEHVAEPATAATAPATANGQERQTALEFLKVLVPQWCSKGIDTTAVATGIAANPVIARHFTAQSPEVIQLMAACAK